MLKQSNSVDIAMKMVEYAVEWNWPKITEMFYGMKTILYRVRILIQLNLQDQMNQFRKQNIFEDHGFPIYEKSDDKGDFPKIKALCANRSGYKILAISEE